MSIFPYIQLLVMLAFIAVVYFAVLSTKKAEQNKVWVTVFLELGKFTFPFDSDTS